MEYTPLVSVIVPAYNAERFIERTLRSVIAQTYQRMEVIVVDDGSRDNTAGIVREIACEDQRIRLLQQPNGGVAAARNTGILNATGAFIAPIDSDDIWHPQNLEKQVQCFLQSEPSTGLVYSWSVDIDEEDRFLGSVHDSRIAGHVFPTLLLHNFIANASCTLIRRACLEKVGLYDCSLKERSAQGCEDWDLYLRIAERYTFQVVPEFLTGYRKLQSSMSGNSNTMARSLHLIWEAIRQRYPDVPSAMRRLSTSSFYKYLAHENNRCGKYDQALLWLFKTLKADPFTPFFRPSFYLLLAQSMANRSIQWITSTLGYPPDAWFKYLQGLANHDLFPEPEKWSRKKQLRLKPEAEQWMHRSTTVLFGQPHNWKHHERMP